MIEKEGDFNFDALLAKNRAYLDRKWRDIKVKLEYPDTFPAIISRAIYHTMGEGKGLGILTEDRLSLMQRYFVNSLRNQTNSNFIIHLVVGPEDNETVKRIKNLNWGTLNVNFMHLNDDLSNWKNSVKNIGSEVNQGCPEDLVRNANIPKTSIMARLDTDDWIAPGWIAHIKHMAATKPESHFLINYQVIGQGIDGRLYNFSNVHTRARTSPFIVLVQKEEPRISPYEGTHLSMGHKFATVYDIQPSYAFMVIHKGNRSNRFYPKDNYFENIETQKEMSKVIPITIKQIRQSNNLFKELIDG